MTRFEGAGKWQLRSDQIRTRWHISHLEGGLRTLGATAAERETALRELTAELRERIVEIEAAREERICLERELLIRNEYLSELRQEMGEADAKLRGLEAEIERMRHAEGEGVTLRAELRAAHERMTAFEDFVQQPRHRLSDRVNSWMRRARGSAKSGIPVPRSR